MSEEILEQQSEEELEEKQQAVAESSDEEITEQDEESEEETDDEEEVEEAYEVPKTKAGMVKAIYDSINSMKKAELSDSFTKIMGSTLVEEEEEESDDDEEEENPKYNKDSEMLDHIAQL